MGLREDTLLLQLKNAVVTKLADTKLADTRAPSAPSIGRKEESRYPDEKAFYHGEAPWDQKTEGQRTKKRVLVPAIVALSLCGYYGVRHLC